MAQSIKAPERSILVVDDEPFIRFNIADFFADEGYRVFEAGDADEAIAIFDQSPGIRIVLTDVRMPGSMDGLKLAHCIRERCPAAVLVVASGAIRLTRNQLPARAMFVAKPFDARFVLGEIERMAS